MSCLAVEPEVAVKVVAVEEEFVKMKKSREFLQADEIQMVESQRRWPYFFGYRKIHLNCCLK